MNTINLVAMLTILLLAFVQNISFSIVSRSRNRNNMKYHLIAAAFSNTIWFLTFQALIKGDMNFILFMPYCVGTMCGSLCGVRISMFIEKFLGAEADGHLKKDFGPTTEDLAAYWDYLQKDETYGCGLEFRKWIEADKPKTQIEETIKPMSDELKYTRYKDSRKGLPKLGFEAWKKTGMSN